MFCQVLFVLQFSHDVTCIRDEGSEIVCKMEKRNISARREAIELPLYLPYIPQNRSIVFDCSNPVAICTETRLTSIIQVADKSKNLKVCLGTGESIKCENSHFALYNNIDKLLFLENQIAEKNFYMTDCLLYGNDKRICERKDGDNTHSKLMQTGETLRPNDKYILMQDELICEESKGLIVYCDTNKLVPYPIGFKSRKTADISGSIALKTNTNIIQLNYTCVGAWCGYTNDKLVSRRYMKRYEFDAGKAYKCYSAKGQKICKEIIDYDPYNNEENDQNLQVEVLT